jgi:hypothetical protein
MRYVIEKTMREFEAWSGAKWVHDRLTYAELDILDELIDELQDSEREELLTETEINDILWFDLEDWLVVTYDELASRETRQQRFEMYLDGLISPDKI